MSDRIGRREGRQAVTRLSTNVRKEDESIAPATMARLLSPTLQILNVIMGPNSGELESSFRRIVMRITEITLILILGQMIELQRHILWEDHDLQAAKHERTSQSYLLGGCSV